MKITKQDWIIFNEIKESHSADEWKDYIDIWSMSGHFRKPEWRLLRLSELGLMEKRLYKYKGWYDWQFKIKNKNEGLIT